MLTAPSPGSGAQAPSQPGEAPLSVQARVSLKLIEDRLKSSIDDGQRAGARPTGIAGLEVRYRVEVPRLALAARGAELLVNVPVRLELVSGQVASPIGKLALGAMLGAIGRAGCASMLVSTESFVGLAVRDGKLAATVRQGEARGDGCAATLAGLGLPVNALLRNLVGAPVRTAIESALAPERLAALVASFQARAIERFSRPQALPLEGSALSLRFDTAMKLETVAVRPASLQVGLRVAVSPQIVFDAAPVQREPTADGRGFTVPIEIVIPLATVPASTRGRALEMVVPGGNGQLRLSRVALSAGLVRLDLVQGANTSPLLYFALQDRQAVHRVLDGTLDDLLAEAAAWLADPSSWPAEARGDSERLAAQVAMFRGAVANALTRLDDIPLGPGLSFALHQPQIRLGSGRFENGMIRIPADLSGFATVDIAIE